MGVGRRAVCITVTGMVLYFEAVNVSRQNRALEQLALLGRIVVVESTTSELCLLAMAMIWRALISTCIEIAAQRDAPGCLCHCHQSHAWQHL